MNALKFSYPLCSLQKKATSPGLNVIADENNIDRNHNNESTGKKCLLEVRVVDER